MDSEPGGRGQHDLQCRGDDTSSKDRAKPHSQANHADPDLDAHPPAHRHPHTNEQQGDQNADSAPRVAHGFPAVAGRANSHPQAYAATAAILALIFSTDGSVAASRARETGGGISSAVTLAMGQSR